MSRTLKQEYVVVFVKVLCRWASDMWFNCSCLCSCLLYFMFVKFSFRTGLTLALEVEWKQILNASLSCKFSMC